MMIEIHEIKTLRKKLGVTQTKLAEKAGVSQAYIAKIECNKIDPKVSTFNKILRALEDFKKDTKRAKDVMNSPIFYVHPEDTLIYAMDIMRENDISQLPVIRGESAIGSLTEKSLARKLDIEKIKEFAGKKVKMLMGDPFPVVSKNEILDIVLTLLKENNAVLVKSETKFVGIITRVDILSLVYLK
ncbi:MAG: CBS domain-containing protein [Methanomicrobia archaeon]|nr:CBS domain-containing protein [Methanomicrobia archaeon]MCK4432323.1 CBS domain-containing protein [Methanomicrobia archaeon]MCK4637548.1 CBS domain-containing protein [Methanomicrobia archaeon]